MIFRDIHVDGFGVWHDLTLDDLSPDLNVFWAPNEGGKSTLMYFLRAVLYGFERRGNPRRYEPLRGGVHGGHIDVETDSRRFRILRTDDGTSAGGVEIRDGDGEVLSDGALDRLLANTTQSLYEAVFAFGLDELQMLDTLQEEEVAGHIYSAGMAAGGVSPIAFRQKMVDRMDSLYRPRGRNQPVPELLSRIEELQSSIQELRQRPDRYEELLEKRRAQRRRIEELDEELAERQRRLGRVKRARNGWSHFQEMVTAEATLASMGVDLDPALRGRIATPDDDATPGEAPADQDRDDGRIDVGDLLPASRRRLLGHAGRIHTLYSNLGHLNELHTEVQKARQAARQAQAQLEKELDDLGEGWTVERLRDTTADIALREEIRSHEETMRRHTAKVEALAGRAEDAHQTFEAVAGRPDPISRETVAFVWILVVAAALVTATITPGAARLIASAIVLAVGATAAGLVTWLRMRGQKQRFSDRSDAADREAVLWNQHDEAKVALEEAVDRWESWLEERDLPVSLTPEGTLDLLDRIREAQETDRRVREAEEQAEHRIEQLRAGCDRVEALLADLEIEIAEIPEDPRVALEALSQELEAVYRDLQAAEKERERLRSVLERYVQARAALRAVAGEEGLESLRQRLETTDPEGLEEKMAEAEAALEEVRSARDAVAEEHGAVGEQIVRMERDEDLSRALQERERLRADLVDTVEDWATFALTVALFDEAKRRYEAERQPEVLKAAGRYMGAMTEGRYDRVLAPLGENRLEIQRARTGQRLRPEQLSRGTAEQLYLAMRLALASVYARESVSLPIVADDILVNFDDDRVVAAARMLGDYAREGPQVLLFTCHRRLVDVFERHAEGVSVRPLAPDGGSSG